MCAWGRKGCVGVAEVSLRLTLLLPSSFQGSLGPVSHPRTPRWSVIREGESGGTYPGTVEAARPRMQSWRVSKDIKKKLGDSQSDVCSNYNTVQPAWGIERNRQTSPKLPWSKFSTLCSGVSIPAASCAQSSVWTCPRRLLEDLSSWRNDLSAGRLAALPHPAVPLRKSGQRLTLMGQALLSDLPLCPGVSRGSPWDPTSTPGQLPWNTEE